MFINAGMNCMLYEEDIIGIFDIESSTQAEATRNFLAAEQKKLRVVNIAYDLPKTFIVCRENGNLTVYLSQYSSSVLMKRKTERTYNNG